MQECTAGLGFKLILSPSGEYSASLEQRELFLVVYWLVYYELFLQEYDKGSSGASSPQHP